MATKTKKPAETTTAPAAIPSMVRDPAPAPAAKKASPADLLKLMAGSKPATPKPASKSRPEVKLTPEATVTMRNFAPAKELFDHFESHLDNLKAEVKELVFPLYVDTMWSQKSQPANPAIKVSRESDGKPDIESVYIVQEKYKVNADSEDTAIKLLVDLGVPPTDAARLVSNELDFSPYVGIRLEEMVRGHKAGDGWIDASDAEQALATKIMQWYNGDKTVEPPTQAERELGLEIKPNCRVKSGFLERVAGYAQTKDQLSAIFKVITPVAFAKGGKFGISDSLDEKNTRLLQEAAKILGTSLGISSED